MGQVKIYGVKEQIQPIKRALSDVIHSCMVEALELPNDKKFHRFFVLEKEDFQFPSDRTDAYTIIEISMFEGRTVKVKKRLIALLYERIHRELSIPLNDIEITIFETPRHNWGIRGLPGDEIGINYKVNI